MNQDGARARHHNELWGLGKGGKSPRKRKGERRKLRRVHKRKELHLSFREWLRVQGLNVNVGLT